MSRDWHHKIIKLDEALAILPDSADLQSALTTIIKTNLIKNYNLLSL